MRSRSITRSIATILLAVTAMSAAPALARDVSVVGCLAITDSAARLACYDKIAHAQQAALARAAGAQPAAPAKAAESAAPPTTPAKAAPPAAPAAVIAAEPQATPMPPPEAAPPQVVPPKVAPQAAPTKTAKAEPPAATETKAELRKEFGFSATQREKQKPRGERQLDQISAVVASARSIGPGYWEFTMRDGSVWRLTEMRSTFRPPRLGGKVTIRRASLGSYFLDVGRQPSIRVKRVQ